MNRTEIELKIAEKAKELDALIREYYPQNHYFSLAIIKSEQDEKRWLIFNNEYWEAEEEDEEYYPAGRDFKYPIRFSVEIDK